MSTIPAELGLVLSTRLTVAMTSIAEAASALGGTPAAQTLWGLNGYLINVPIDADAEGSVRQLRAAAWMRRHGQHAQPTPLAGALGKLAHAVETRDPQVVKAAWAVNRAADALTGTAGIAAGPGPYRGPAGRARTVEYGI
jgi:hypothetical protein